MTLTIYHSYLERETLHSQVGGYESLNMKHERVLLQIAPFFIALHVCANYTALVIRMYPLTRLAKGQNKVCDLFACFYKNFANGFCLPIYLRTLVSACPHDETDR